MLLRKLRDQHRAAVQKHREAADRDAAQREISVLEYSQVDDRLARVQSQATAVAAPTAATTANEQMKGDENQSSSSPRSSMI